MFNEILSRRLKVHHLDGRKAESPLEAVKSLGALQAQDYDASLWAIGIRCKDGTTIADVESSISGKEITRTWLLRGTLHISASEDVKWMIEPTTERLLRTAAQREKSRGLEEETVEKTKSAIREALSGDKMLTRHELYSLMERCGVPTENNLGYHMLYRAAWAGIICMGPQQGKEQTFVLLDEWLENFKSYPSEQLNSELAVRYFSGHGPATLKDFVWWSGLKITEARAAVEAALNRIGETESDGTAYYFTGEQYPPIQEEPHALLLPAFDEYIVGYSDRSYLIGQGDIKRKGENSSVKFIHSNGVFLPTVLWEGRVVGTWKKQRKEREVKIMVKQFEHFGKEIMSSVGDAADDYGNFLESRATLIFEKI